MDLKDTRANDHARRNRRQSNGASGRERLRREKAVAPVQEHGRALAELELEDGWS